MRSAAVFLFIFLSILSADAQAVSINFCFESVADYIDNHDNYAALSGGAREDYYTTDGDKPLRGVYARLQRRS